ncbi:hypothetical protein E2C01_057174 [Portunus trituberculatus]|uniref:Uncharacterized protein n=1 Tax=Portunus trituberculatus TaxID=210409 RepID=A0A5B7GSA8_PORTR|nr:hypothetical protein [Portunus trituberculatus]
MIGDTGIGGVDRIGIRERREVCAWSQREGRHAVNKVRRTVRVKTATEYSKTYNIGAMRKKLKTRGYLAMDSKKRFNKKPHLDASLRACPSELVKLWDKCLETWRKSCHTPAFTLHRLPHFPDKWIDIAISH